MGTATTARGAAVLPALEKIFQAPPAAPPPGNQSLAQSLTHMHISKPTAPAPQCVVPKPVPLPLHLQPGAFPPPPQPSIGAPPNPPHHAQPATVPSPQQPHADKVMSFASWARPEPSPAANLVRHSYPSSSWDSPCLCHSGVNLHVVVLSALRMHFRVPSGRCAGAQTKTTTTLTQSHLWCISRP